MKELDIEIVERDNNIPSEKSVLADQQIKNLQVLYSNIEEKYIKLREDFEEACQRLDRMEKSFSSFCDMTIHQLQTSAKKIGDLETEVFPKRDAKEDIEEDKSEDLVCSAFVWKDDYVIELFGTKEEHQLFDRLYKMNVLSPALSKEKVIMLAIDCGLSVKKKFVQ